jgi:hypothetical protein
MLGVFVFIHSSSVVGLFPVEPTRRILVRLVRDVGTIKGVGALVLQRRPNLESFGWTSQELTFGWTSQDLTGS